MVEVGEGRKGDGDGVREEETVVLDREGGGLRNGCVEWDSDSTE